MYERSYGYLYDHQHYHSAAEIAAQIRKDIKLAVSEGLLPGKPVTYSVRCDNYSGGRSIDITVQGWPEAWQECDGYKVGQSRVAGMGRELCRDYFCAAALAITGEDRPGAQRHQVLTEEAQAAKMTLERIWGAYNHDGSDIQVDYFDVNYAGGVTFEDAQSAAWRSKEAAKKSARRKAIDQAAEGEGDGDQDADRGAGRDCGDKRLG